MIGALFSRAKTSSFNVSENTGQFKIIKKTFNQQFSQIYSARIQALRPVILKKLALSNEFYHTGRILDVEDGKDSFIIGTVFCENIDRPNVFEEVENDQISNHKKSKTVKYLKENIYVFLEDESGRIELDISNVSEYPWVTGTTICLKGTADSTGKYFVKQVIEPGIPDITKLQLQQSPSNSDSRFIALVSGLNYGKEGAEYSLERTRMIEFFNGCFHSEFGLNIAKLIIVGNTMSAPIKISNEFKKKYGHEIAKYKVDHLHQIDCELSNLSKSIDIEIMPGEDDLSTLTLPQSPVPKSLFPTLSKMSSVNFTTNPCLFDVNSIKLLGCSGQNIDDIYRHVHSNDRLFIAEKSLAWRNIAPTTPDSLYCYPFHDKDPFIINEAPHVYFIGNQPTFETKLVKTDSGIVRIVLVPDFSETGTIVLINIDDLTAVPMKIKC